MLWFSFLFFLELVSSLYVMVYGKNTIALSLVLSVWERNTTFSIMFVMQKNPPNGYLYNASVQGLFLRGNIDLAMEFYAEMKELDLNADGKTRALVLQNLPKGSRWG